MTSMTAPARRTLTSPLDERLIALLTHRYLEPAVMALVSGVIVVFGARAVLGLGGWSDELHRYVRPGDSTTLMGLGSLVVSVAAVWLSSRRPLLASAVALSPFTWLLVNDAWLLWWFVAQVAVVALVAVRSWRWAVWPAVGMLASGALVVSQISILVVAPAADYTLRPFPDGGWLSIHLGAGAAASVLAAAVGAGVRAGMLDRLLTARESAVVVAGAMQAERARLAHDLHDVIAHHVSLIAVRAEAAPYTDPGMGARANDVLGEIADDARRALDELRGVLGVLHRSGETPELAPQPTIRDLPDLIDRATNAGDRITTDGVDDSWIVPDTVGYVVHRLIQESLTNARRHARGGRVQVALQRDDDEVVTIVENSAGKGPTRTAMDGGEGLAAMTERVEALGGLLVAGPTGDGGFKVTARVPLVARRP